MSLHRCPGQQTRFWKPKDIFEAKCPHCGATVEFFKDDRIRTCPKCGERCPNPKLDLGCLEWCKHADECKAVIEEREDCDEKKHHKD